MNRVILAKVLFRSVCKGDSHMNINASVTTLDGVNFVYKNAAHCMPGNSHSKDHFLPPGITCTTGLSHNPFTWFPF